MTAFADAHPVAFATTLFAVLLVAYLCAVYLLFHMVVDVEDKDGAWPWCDACRSYHHPDNPFCFARRD